MRKSEYKRVSGKTKWIQDRERHRGIFCISQKWHKWAKRYMNRQERRRKDNIYG